MRFRRNRKQDYIDRLKRINHYAQQLDRLTVGRRTFNEEQVMQVINISQAIYVASRIKEKMR